MVLKTRKLLILRDARNAENGKIAANWNVSGTRAFQPARQFREKDLPSPATASSFQVPFARCLPPNPFLIVSGLPTNRPEAVWRINADGDPQ